MKKLLFFLFTITLTTSFAQNGLHFDGNSDLVQTTFPGILGNNAITVEAWIQPEGNNGEEVITAWGSDAISGGRFTFRCATSGTNRVIRIENKGGGINGSINVADGNWHHVAVTYDPIASTNKYKLYVDGVLDAQGNISQALNIVAATNMRIGRRLSASFTGFFDGKMDEIRVWNVVRTPAELMSNKDNELCAYPTSLVAYYKFNEGVAAGTNTGITNLPNAVGSGDGTLTTFSLTGTTSNWVTGATSPGTGLTTTNVYTECSGFSILVNGNTYNTTGVYSDTIVSGAVNGCDSIIVTDLTLVNQIVHNQTFNECTGFSVTVNGNVYNTTGLYTDTIVGGASGGCDSVIVTDLTVLNSSLFTQTFNECPGFSVQLNGNTYNTTGVYYDTLVGAASNGCDSIVTTDLTIFAPVAYTQTLNECAGFSITVGANTYNSTGIYTTVLLGAAANGCDSTITTDLTIAGPIDVTTTTSSLTITATNSTGAYQWIDCDNGNTPIAGETNQSFTATANGNYAVVITDGNCSDTSNCATIATIGLDEMKYNAMTVSPNPVSDVVIVNIEGDQKPMDLTICNFLGQKVITIENYVVGNPIQTQDLEKGTYLLILNANDSKYQTKFVKL